MFNKSLLSIALYSFLTAGTAHAEQEAEQLDPEVAIVEQALLTLSANPAAINDPDGEVAAALGPAAVQTLQTMNRVVKSDYRAFRPSGWMQLANALSEAEQRGDFFLWKGQLQRDLSDKEKPVSATLKYLFRYYLSVAIAGETANEPKAPYFIEVNGKSVNQYFYLAARMCACDAELTTYALRCGPLTDEEMQEAFPKYGTGESGVKKSVWYYVDQINKGVYGPAKADQVGVIGSASPKRPNQAFVPTGKHEE